MHLPVWVLGTEKNAIEGRIDEWTDQLESCGAHIHSLAKLASCSRFAKSATSSMDLTKDTHMVK